MARRYGDTQVHRDTHTHTAINTSTSGARLYPVFFCKSLDLWLLSPFSSNIVLCFSIVVWKSHIFLAVN